MSRNPPYDESPQPQQQASQPDDGAEEADKPGLRVGIERRRFLKLAMSGGAFGLLLTLTPSRVLAQAATCTTENSNSCTGAGVSNNCTGATANTCSDAGANSCNGGGIQRVLVDHKEYLQ